MRRDTQLERELADTLQRARLVALNATGDREQWGGTAVAKRIGVTKPCLSQWENGRCFPSSFKLWRLWGKAVGVVVRIGVGE